MTARAAVPATMLTWDTGRRVRTAVPSATEVVIVNSWLFAESVGCLAW